MVARLDPESLLRVPLVDQFLNDAQVGRVPRAIDLAWSQRKHLPETLIGFNPVHSAVYYAQGSAMAAWLERPRASARALNFQDFLARDVMFAVHDYLHAWAYLAINELMPDLGFGTAPITTKNREAFVFCHLLTEAVATVGLDYWYLSTVKLNEVCPIGTRLETLTTPYHEQYKSEYHRFNPAFEVQSEGFFRELTEFYCSGRFFGFGLDDVKNSAVLLSWLQHELRYGELQRVYVRQWFDLLAGVGPVTNTEHYAAPTRCNARWQKRLMTDLGSLLWEKVKKGTLHRFRFAFDRKRVWRSPTSAPLDFRFLNWNGMRDASLAGIENHANAVTIVPRLAYQLIIARPFAKFEPAEVENLVKLCNVGGLSTLQLLLRRVEPLEPEVAEPRDLFLLS